MGLLTLLRVQARDLVLRQAEATDGERQGCPPFCKCRQPNRSIRHYRGCPWHSLVPFPPRHPAVLGRGRRRYNKRRTLFRIPVYIPSIRQTGGCRGHNFTCTCINGWEHHGISGAALPRFPLDFCSARRAEIDGPFAGWVEPWMVACVWARISRKGFVRYKLLLIPEKVRAVELIDDSKTKSPDCSGLLRLWSSPLNSVIVHKTGRELGFLRCTWQLGVGVRARRYFLSCTI